MTILTESKLEEFAIEELQKLGFKYLYGPELAPGERKSERAEFSQVLLIQRLQNSIAKLNPGIPLEAREQAIREIQKIHTPELIANNEAFHKFLTEGIPVSFRSSEGIRHDNIQLIDFENPGKNEFLVINQFTIIESNVSSAGSSFNKRPDLILFINGIPLVVIELKNPGDENANVRKAYDQLQTYKATIPSLFTYNAFLVASDGLDARAGTISSAFSRFAPWKTADGKVEASHHTGQIETLIRGMLNKETLLDLIRSFIVFEETRITDKTDITVIRSEKKIAAYHQYYAVNKSVESTIRAASITGNKKGGVVWHTQGSGKSLSMVFYAGKLVQKLNNPTILVITDRNDLDDQLFETFAGCIQLLRQEPVQAESRDQLKELLKVASGGIVFSTIQKFLPDTGNVYDLLSDRSNLVVIADEAHRTQYGFQAKTMDERDKETKEVIGKRIVYGFAKYLRDAVPNATYIGFTGTPVESTDHNTAAVFGNYIDIYDIARAVDDGATVKIFYESRLAKVNLGEEAKHLLDELDTDLEREEVTLTQQAKSKWTRLEAIVGSDSRIQNIARDIIQHFEARQLGSEGKGMIVCMSRRIAVKLYEEMIKLRPVWHQTDLNQGALKVVMTTASSDKLQFDPEDPSGIVIPSYHRTNKTERHVLSERMKNPEDPLKLVIVRDMWLTGFDVPCLHTMYLDKPMKGHTLMQAIARVNRIYKDKPGGLIVDYLGIASDLKKALSFYSESGGTGDPTNMQQDAVNEMQKRLEVIRQMYLEKSEDSLRIAAEGAAVYMNQPKFNYNRYFTASTSEKLTIILQAEEHVLSLEHGKERYLHEVSALSKVFSLALPHESAMEVKEEVAFFQAVKGRLVKLTIGYGGNGNVEIDTAIRQVIDQAIVSDKVIDIFGAAGINKPDISILSEEFMEEIKGMKHRNLALELLKKILTDEIHVRTKVNMIQSRSLMEMLEDSIRRYQTKILTTTEIIQELIDLAKEIKKADARGESMGLSQEELAFYDAVADNESAREVLGDDILRDLARVLVTRVRANATLDWTVKESVRAKLKVVVKRTLRQFGYPPDKEILATETVLKQAELLAEDWAN